MTNEASIPNHERLTWVLKNLDETFTKKQIETPVITQLGPEPEAPLPDLLPVKSTEAPLLNLLPVNSPKVT